MDLFESLEFTAGQEDLSLSPEPEWITLNRQWAESNPNIHYQKYPCAALDGWISIEPTQPGSDLMTNDEPMHLSKLFRAEPPPRKRSFIDKMDLDFLVDEPDSYSIDKLFLEPDDASTSSESKRRLWSREEEQALAKFIEFYGKHSQVPSKAWQLMAEKLGRSVVSLRTKANQIRRFGLRRKTERARNPRSNKPTTQQMIKEALLRLPNYVGTKDEIISKMEEVFGALLADESTKKEPTWKRTVKQTLCTYFPKIEGYYKLKPNSPIVTPEKCISMSDYIVWILGNHGSLTKHKLKEKIQEVFGQTLNNSVSTSSKLMTWEKTFLKKLKTCPYLDSSMAEARFTLQK